MSLHYGGDKAQSSAEFPGFRVGRSSWKCFWQNATAESRSIKEACCQKGQPLTLCVPQEYSTNLFLAVFLLVALLFPLAPLALAGIWSRIFKLSKPGAEKNAVYECGLQSKGDAWIQFRADYYLYGIIFLIFDVETIFLFPFATAFLELSFGAFLAMMVFLLLLVEGLVWAWRKGVLTWK
jgi:NADH:ubiquinone oxidoreductase subunit 3 (subunit A)